MTALERAKYIYTQCTAAGMTHAGAIGLLGNLQGETAAFEPTKLQTSYANKFGLTDGEYTRRADNDEVIYNGKYFIKDSAGYGIAQWTWWSRKQNLLNYARSLGKSVGDLEVQVAFLINEIKTGYPSTWKILTTTGDYGAAVKICVTDYERPANQSDAISRRTGYAKNWDAAIAFSASDSGKTDTSTQNDSASATTGYDRRKVIQLALEQVGYLEKKSNSQLDDKTANAGSANYTKYARDLDAIDGFYNGKKNGYAWCDIFVDWLFVKCFGVEAALNLLCADYNSAGAGCTYSMGYYRAKGQFVARSEKPQVGDQIFFGTGQNSSTHTGIVYAVDSSAVYTIEGNTSGASGVVANGGGVCKKSYSRDYSGIIGYGRPAYNDGFTGDSVENSKITTPTETSNENNTNNSATDNTSADTTTVIKKGDLVKISSGAKWYSGGTIPSWVIAMNWYVVQSIGGRTVIDKSEDGSKSIMSPVFTSDLTVVNTAVDAASDAYIGGEDEPIVDDSSAEVNGETDAVINPPVLKNGDGTANGKEVAVTKLQHLLIDSGYSVGEDGADGDFGANTEAAIKALQAATGKVQTGEADINVYAALLN